MRVYMAKVTYHTNPGPAPIYETQHMLIAAVDAPEAAALVREYFYEAEFIDSIEVDVMNHASPIVPIDEMTYTFLTDEL